MTANFLWAAVGTVMNLMTTELNSAAASTLYGPGPEINNSSGYQMGQLYLHNASFNNTTASALGVYFVPSNDTAGTTYPTLTSFAAAALSNYLSGVIYINQANAVENDNLPFCTIPLGKFKTYAAPIAGSTTFASSGNTLDMYPTPSQY